MAMHCQMYGKNFNKSLIFLLNKKSQLDSASKVNKQGRGGWYGVARGATKLPYPILDTRISVCLCVRVFVCSCVTLRGPPLDSETGWTGELWSNPVLLILEN